MLLGLCTTTMWMPREPPIISPLDFRGTVAPLCFAFKASHHTWALHTSPSSLSPTGTSSRCLGSTHWEQGRNHRACPRTCLPSRKLLFMDSLSPWLHLVIIFERYCWRYLWQVCPVSLTEHLHPLGNESHGLEQVGFNIYLPFPNFACDAGHCSQALAGSAGAV